VNPTLDALAALGTAVGWITLVMIGVAPMCLIA